MINALSIDLEFWYSGEPFSHYTSNTTEDQIEHSVKPLLNLFDKYNTRSTFFVLGSMAEKYPTLIKKINLRGHEIASHGYSHKRLHLLNEKRFEEELKKSIKLLKKICNENPVGFRAPSFSIDNSTIWALPILKKMGFKYDSSVFPKKGHLYGVPDAPLGPYNPSFNNITKTDPNVNLIEFPLSVIKIGKNIPISGGHYFRVLPYWFIRTAIRKINQIRSVIMYFHPWEIYPRTPRLNIPPLKKFYAYYGINNALYKIEKLFKEFKFAPIKEVLQI